VTTESATILVDNRAGAGLVAERGLALWLQSGGRRILFDTGQGPALAANAPALRVDLRDCDALVLSHGHYDHTGGVSQVLGSADKVHIYCHPAALRPRYSIRDGMPRSIGMPPASAAAVAKLPVDKLHWVEQPVWLSERIGLTGVIPRETDYEDTGGPFFLDREARETDPIDDDLALWVRSDEGLVICVGCGHAGLVNTVRSVQRLNDGLRVHAIIGGFHLGSASEQRLSQTVAALRSLEPEVVVPCHCTGEKAVALLQRSLGERVLPGASGATYRWVAADGEHHVGLRLAGGTT